MDACGRTRPTFSLENKDWPEEAAFGIVNQTVGWLLSYNRDWTVVSAEVDEYGQVRDLTEIPTAIVLEIEVLAQ